MKIKSCIASLLIFTAFFSASCGNTNSTATSEIKESATTTTVQTAFTEPVTTEDSSKPETTAETTVSMELETTVDKHEEKRPEHYFYTSPPECFYYAAEFYCDAKVSNVDYGEQIITMENGRKILCTGFDSNLGLGSSATEMLISDIEDYYFNTDDIPDGIDGEIIFDPDRNTDEDYTVKSIDENAELPYLECVWRKAEEVSGEKVTEITYYDIGLYGILKTQNGKKYLCRGDFGLVDDVAYRDFNCYDANEYLTNYNIDKREYGYPDDLETYEGIILNYTPKKH